jgi:hypothetical protein
MIELVGAFLVGVLVSALVFAFVWRNNKAKFMNYLMRFDEMASKYDSKEELQAALQSVIESLKTKYNLK